MSRPGLSRPAALALAAGVLGASALIGRRNAPDRSHPRIRRWYKALDKPAFTPPDAVFGAVWPLLETGLAAGGCGANRCGGAVAGERRHDRRLDAAVLPRTPAGREHAGGRRDGRQRRGLCAAAAWVDRTAAVAGVPFVAWLGFATLLAERTRAREAVAS